MFVYLFLNVQLLWYIINIYWRFCSSCTSIKKIILNLNLNGFVCCSSTDPLQNGSYSIRGSFYSQHSSFPWNCSPIVCIYSRSALWDILCLLCLQRLLFLHIINTSGKPGELYVFIQKSISVHLKNICYLRVWKNHLF